MNSINQNLTKELIYMKKMFCGVLVILFIVSLVGCDKEKSEEIGYSYSDYTGIGIEIESLDISNDNASVNIKWQNDTPYDVTYGNWYIIEREIEDEWHSCAIADVDFLAMDYILKTGTMHKTYTFGKYFDTSTSGKYRIRSECYVQINDDESEHCIVWAEFIIE